PEVVAVPYMVARLKLLSFVFSTLYPYGRADFAKLRDRNVDYAGYLEHLIKYKDGRFARYPR
ncbi:hypothetical protein B0J12DRAFT_587691, partial [Macrophomina phaseolina]